MKPGRYLVGPDANGEIFATPISETVFAASADTTIKPWQWATIVFRKDPVEIVSYPDPDGMVLVRLIPGDPTRTANVNAASLSAFEPDRHEWFYRPKRYYSDDPNVFSFIDNDDPDDHDLPGTDR